MIWLLRLLLFLLGSTVVMLVLLVVLLTQLPASTLRLLLQDDRLGPDGPVVTHLAGRLLEGQASLAARPDDAPLAELRWRWQLHDLAPELAVHLLGAPGDARGRLRLVSTPPAPPVGASADGHASLFADHAVRVRIDTLTLDMAELNRWLRAVGVDLSGAVSGGDFAFDLGPAGVSGLATTLDYSGGRNLYEFGRQWYDVAIPPLQVELSGSGRRLRGVVIDRTTPMLELDFDGDRGSYRLTVREHAVRLAGHPMDVGADSNAIVMQLEEVLWQ